MAVGATGSQPPTSGTVGAGSGGAADRPGKAHGKDKDDKARPEGRGRDEPGKDKRTGKEKSERGGEAAYGYRQQERRGHPTR